MRSILLIQVIIIVTVLTGWVKDIIKLSQCDFEKPYKAEVVYTVGIIPVVGMITGWMNLGK